MNSVMTILGEMTHHRRGRLICHLHPEPVVEMTRRPVSMAGRQRGWKLIRLGRNSLLLGVHGTEQVAR